MIVGLGFNKEVGKDTAATALGRELGFKRMGFADALKDLALEADPLVVSSTRTVNIGIGHGRLRHILSGTAGWDEAKRMFPEVRIFLQNLGLGARKVFGEDFWVERVMDQAVDRNVAGLHTVISDVRFENEAEAIKAEGGLLIKITRPGKTGDSHVSENDLVDYDGWDVVIENSGSIVELEGKVVTFVRDRMPKTYGELAQEKGEVA